MMLVESGRHESGDHEKKRHTSCVDAEESTGGWMPEFGELLRERRDDAGLTRTELGHRAPLGVCTIKEPGVGTAPTAPS
jgi:hypothetical protein